MADKNQDAGFKNKMAKKQDGGKKQAGDKKQDGDKNKMAIKKTRQWIKNKIADNKQDGG